MRAIKKWLCVFLFLLSSATARSEAGRLFASPEACHSSGAFSAADCAAAFDRATLLMNEQGPHFSNRIDCVLSFKMCERKAGVYQPAMLGVEIRKEAHETIVLPTLAVETPPGMFKNTTHKPDRQVADLPRSRLPARSPYGALLVDGSILVPSEPPTLAKYRRMIEASQLDKRAAKAELAQPPAAVHSREEKF
ncbi:hypothetical protein M2322_004443 [Rhodoblastus acidophilus]|uniref:DUF1190 domain-containing protein n=1 Tax=Rhodoblastus acidophilus TaxID=1074 RepID=UPI002224339F|nr:DUF1190 domain-containing protein [Rhodoblastus acidophilus]MCW2318874.1 hypothetical protein [Rhodoblastus acidophilus]